MFAYMAREAQSRGNVVWFLVHRRELLNQTVDTFDRFGINRETIYIDMVNTVSRRLDNLHIPAPDLIIFDEAHFSAAKTWQRIIDRFPDAYIVGLTATPTRLDGKPLGDIYDTLVEGKSIGSLIDDGYLSPYKYYAPSVIDMTGVSVKRGDYDKKELEEKLMKSAIYGDVVQSYRQYADGKQTVVYCASRNHSKEVAQAFTDAGYSAVHFDGDTPQKERENIIQRFRDGDITIVCNVDLISVGFDMPAIECAILLRPTQSTALYIQQASRALRKQEGKTAIILDHVGNYTRHGLPDDEHTWTLDERFNGETKHDEDGMLLVRQCENCFAVYETKLGKCPQCGAAVEPTQEELEIKKEIELKEIKRQEEQERKERVSAYKDETECRNLEELATYAKLKGYKPGWTYFQSRARGWLK